MENSFENIFQNAINEALQERGHLNILIAGDTGVGKSTLINAVFQGELAVTGSGRPVTQNTREITKTGIPISIFDTRGIEKADYEETMNSLNSFVKERNKDKNSQKHIHVAWVCISEDSRRIEEGEEELVKMLAKYMPIIAVITKARSDNGFRSKVQEILPLVKNVVRVRAIQEELDEGIVLPPMGLKNLVDLTMEVVPEALKKAFAAAQKINIELKCNKSHAIVASAASAAGVAALSPIPFVDDVLVVPLLIGMIASITATFGLSLNAESLISILASIVASAGGTFTKKIIIAELLKLIPGAGTVAGGAISAGTAVVMTTALGEAYIATLKILFEKKQGELPELNEIKQVFKQSLDKTMADTRLQPDPPPPTQGDSLNTFSI